MSPARRVYAKLPRSGRLGADTVHQARRPDAAFALQVHVAQNGAELGQVGARDGNACALQVVIACASSASPALLIGTALAGAFDQQFPVGGGQAGPRSRSLMYQAPVSNTSS